MFERIFASICLVALLQVGSSQNNPQYLTSHLLKGYPEAFKYARPVNDSKETVAVRFGIALTNLYSLQEDSGVASFQAWIRYTWRDYNLVWNPADFGGQAQAYLPPSKIWTPDLRLYNSYGPGIRTEETLAVVSSGGDVLWIPPASFRVMCSTADSKEYNCTFKIGSWVYDGFKLDPDFYDGLEKIDLSDYVASKEYSVVSTTAKKNVKVYPCCKEPYPDLTFNLVLKRNSC